MATTQDQNTATVPSSVPNPQVMTPQSMTGPVSPAKTTAPATTTGYTGLQGLINASTDSFTQGLTANTNAAQQGTQTSLEGLLGALKGQQGQNQLTADAYQQQGVDTAKQKLTDVNNQILAEQRATTDSTRNLQKNAAGYTTAGLSDETQRINNESLQRQADLAVVQQAAQGNYANAKEIADRAVAAKYEQQQNNINTLQFIYTANKDLFTTAQQQEFQTKQADRARALDTAKSEEISRYDQILKQSDPLYQAQIANTRANTAKTYADMANTSTNGTLNGKPQTALQSQIQGFADRTFQANAIIGQNSAAGTSLTKSVLGSTPFVGNFLTGGDYQNLQQAQRNFVNSVLRRESGAAISPSEFSSAAKQYFPQPGDTPSTIAQKAANRETVINNLYQQSNIPAPETTNNSSNQDPLNLGIGHGDPTSSNPLDI